MYRYAQIDLSTGRCLSVSYLSKAESQPHLIPLNESQDVQPGDIRVNGFWERPAPEPPEPSEVDTLKEEILFLKQRDAQMQEDNSLFLEALINAGLIV